MMKQALYRIQNSNAPPKAQSLPNQAQGHSDVLHDEHIKAQT
jgi:hypothetical protein